MVLNQNSVFIEITSLELNAFMSHSLLAGDVLGTVLPPILGILFCIVVCGCCCWCMSDNCEGFCKLVPHYRVTEVVHVPESDSNCVVS